MSSSADARTYTDFHLSQTPTSSGEGTVYTLETSTEDGVFGMQYLMTTQRGFDPASDSYLSPSGLKLNIILDNFPYAEPPVNASYTSPYNLALKVFVATDAVHGDFEYHERSDDLDPRLGVADSSLERGFFSWSETVKASGHSWQMETTVDIEGPGRGRGRLRRCSPRHRGPATLR